MGWGIGVDHGRTGVYREHQATGNFIHNNEADYIAMKLRQDTYPVRGGDVEGLIMWQDMETSPVVQYIWRNITQLATQYLEIKLE